jgi:type IV pilus assembly protein PilQ
MRPMPHTQAIDKGSCVGREKMRLKQLLIVVPLVAVLALAATPELSNISLVSQGNSTVVTITATGAVRHNEYRPVENVMFVDFPGVSAGKLLDRMKGVQMPGLTGYRVVNYAGTGGAQVARVELTLAPGADVKLTESAGAITLRISGTTVPATTVVAKNEAKPVGTAKAPAGTPAMTPATPVMGTHAAAKDAAEKMAAAGTPSLVRNISVQRAADGIQIEIAGTAPMEPKALKLSHPDRIVVDLANSAPTGQRNVPVNAGEVVAVRMGQFQSAPPVTRVVVDMRAPLDFDVSQNGNNVIVKVKAAKVAQPAEKQQPTPAPLNAATKKPHAAAVQNSAVPAPPMKSAPVEKKMAEVKPPSMPTAQTASPAPAVTPGGGPAEGLVITQPTYSTKIVEAPASSVMKADSAARTMAQNSVPQQVTTPSTSATTATIAPTAAVNFAAEQRQTQGQVPSGVTIRERPRYTGEPISVNLKDADLKDFFRLVHEISGLNIVLDPNVKGTLTLVLDDVPWDQALDIVLKNNALDRQLEGNVLRIATIEGLRREAELRRAQVQAQALAVDKVSVTRFLSYAHSKDVLPTVKKLLSARGDVITDDRTNALIIQDIPSVIPEIDKLLATLDRKTQEVEIEARVVAATRNFARDIGMQIGAGFANRATAVGGSATDSPLLSNGTPAGLIQTAGAIPLFSNLPAISPTSGISLGNIGANYRIDAILTMAESRGLLKVLSRPRIVTQNNTQALVRQGLRVPVTTLGQLGGPPTVAFIDAFLRLTVTPQITAEGTIFLNIDVENTTADFSRQVNGNPTLVTQQATTQVLVTDGGTAVVGGVIQTQSSVAYQQVPLLGDVPGLGNLFKRKATTTSTQELIFFITPKIIQT